MNIHSYWSSNETLCGTNNSDDHAKDAFIVPLSIFIKFLAFFQCFKKMFVSLYDFSLEHNSSPFTFHKAPQVHYQMIVTSLYKRWHSISTLTNLYWEVANKLFQHRTHQKCNNYKIAQYRLLLWLSPTSDILLKQMLPCILSIHFFLIKLKQL